MLVGAAMMASLLLNAIGEVESPSGVPRAGDGGRALSLYQIHRATWQDVYDRYGAKPGFNGVDVGQRFEDIGGADFDSLVRARNTGSIHIGIIEEFLQKHHQPTSARKIYACWNLGCEGFRKRCFTLKNCPLITQTNARKVAELAKVKAEPEKRRGAEGAEEAQRLDPK